MKVNDLNLRVVDQQQCRVNTQKACLIWRNADFFGRYMDLAGGEFDEHKVKQQELNKKYHSMLLTKHRVG